MHLGFIGLGKMGSPMVARLLQRGHKVVIYDQLLASVKEAEKKGAQAANSLKALVAALKAPRTIWVMVPYEAVDAVIQELVQHLEARDTVIDGGNSYFEDSLRRAKTLSQRGIHFLDAGVSGGPGGVKEGLCLMVGGNEEAFKKHKKLFSDLAAKDAVRLVGHSGAGHFVKMVHNGIEYGMMQSLAEGFSVLHQSDFNLDLKAIADLYNHRSVIESRLVAWLKDAFEKYGNELDAVSGSVGATGEGEWTVETAKVMHVPMSAIEAALRFREASQQKPSYAGRVLSALRNMFGGHTIKS